MVSLMMLNAWQWAQYATVSNKIAFYYRTTEDSVNYMALMFGFVYVPAFFPAAYIVQRFGLRIVILTGATFNATG